MYQRFYSKLIRRLGTYFSIEICHKINVRINFFFFIILLDFLFFTNLFADFCKFFKCRNFNKIPKILQKMFVNNKTLQKLITE